MVNLKLACKPENARRSVSVIVPCYKQSIWLPEAISSIRAQTHKPDEIIVAAGDYESRLAADSLGVRTVDDGAKGLANARNVGIAAAKSKYIICLDADDALEPAYIEKTLSLAGNDRLVIVSTNLYEVGERNGYWDLPPYSRQYLLRSNCLTVPSLYSKELWEMAGGYNVSLLGREDWAFWISCSKFAPAVRHVPERLLRYRIHSTSMTVADSGIVPVIDAQIKITHPFDYSVQDILDAYTTVGNMDDKTFDYFLRRAVRFPENRRVANFWAIVSQARGDHAMAKLNWEIVGPTVGPVA